MFETLHVQNRTLRCCLVCGSREVRTDEVVDRGLVLLNECPRCEYRWTAQMPDLSVASLPPRSDEVSAAA